MSDGRVEQTSFCRICNAMCGIIVTLEGERVLRVRGDAGHPISQGYTCPTTPFSQGRFSASTASIARIYQRTLTVLQPEGASGSGRSPICRALSGSSELLSAA